MHHLRLLIIALVTVFVLALGAFALVSRPVVPPPGDDDIIIKGGSLEIDCGKNHKTDNAGCLSLDDGLTGKFKHKQGGKHVTKIVVINTQNEVVFDSSTTTPEPKKPLGNKPEVRVTYTDATSK